MTHGQRRRKGVCRARGDESVHEIDVLATHDRAQSPQVALVLGAIVHAQQEVRPAIDPHHRRPVRLDAEHVVAGQDVDDVGIPGDERHAPEHQRRCVLAQLLEQRLGT